VGEVPKLTAYETLERGIQRHGLERCAVVSDCDGDDGAVYGADGVSGVQMVYRILNEPQRATKRI
jgi:hypothetical protein